MRAAVLRPKLRPQEVLTLSVQRILKNVAAHYNISTLELALL